MARFDVRGAPWVCSKIIGQAYLAGFEAESRAPAPRIYHAPDVNGYGVRYNARGDRLGGSFHFFVKTISPFKVNLG